MAALQHDPVIAGTDVAGKRQCALFLPRKGRNCRMQATKDSLYCGEHLTLDAQVTTWIDPLLLFSLVTIDINSKKDSMST